MAKKSTGVLRLVACRTLNSLRSPRRRSRLRFPVKRITAEHMFFFLFGGELLNSPTWTLSNMFTIQSKSRLHWLLYMYLDLLVQVQSPHLKGLAFLASCNEDVFMLVIYEVTFKQTGALFSCSSVCAVLWLARAVGLLGMNHHIQ